MNSLEAYGRGLFWAAAIGIVAFFYGYYRVASGWLGLWTLVVLAAASVGVLGLFRGRSKGIAGVNYQMCLVAIWYGHLNGTMALGAPWTSDGFVSAFCGRGCFSLSSAGSSLSFLLASQIARVAARIASPPASCLPLPGLSPAGSHNFDSSENNPLSCFAR